MTSTSGREAKGLAGPDLEITVARLATTAVKGTRLRNVDEVMIEPGGAAGDRAFLVIDARGRMINGKISGELQAVVADYDRSRRQLKLSFPDGTAAAAPIEHSGTVPVRFFSQPVQARLLAGPWAQALSAFLGSPVRLVESGSGIDRGPRGAASLVSSASLARLAEVADQDEIDSRRFRMLIEVDGVAANAEDRWVGRRVRVGEALLRMNGNIGRCRITSMDPDTGQVDLPTLDLLGQYRRELEVASTEPLPLGIYGEVLKPGAVRVGDAVSIE